MFTFTFRPALIATLVAASATAADAQPRRLVILDFDGPRSLADAGRNEVVSLLGAQYDVVATKRWESARAKAQQRSAGPSTWQKAAKTAKVDAVIEGWVQDEGRHTLLTVAVREARTGQELDTVSVRIGSRGLSDNNRDKLQTELDGVLAYIEGAPDPLGSPLKLIETRDMIGAKATRRDAPARIADDDDAAADDDDEVKPRKKRKTRRKRLADLGEEIELDGDDATEDDAAVDDETPAKADKREDTRVAAREDDLSARETNDLVTLFGATSDEGQIADPKAAHVPTPTPRFRVSGGGYYGSRSFNIAAENQTGVTPFPGVPSKGLDVNALVFPFPQKKLDGRLSGIGFSLNISKSAGSEFSFDDGETVTEYVVNQNAYRAGVHYRHPLAELVTFDGSVSYGKSSYLIPDAPETLEVPDVSYSYLGGGAGLDLHITERASVGFGARYYYLLDVGDVSSVDWYGPGRASGLGLNANFVVPLPKNLYVQGGLSWDRFKIVYDGVGVITEEEGVSETSDSTVNGSLNLGIEF